MTTLAYISLTPNNVLNLAAGTAAAASMNVPVPRASTPGPADVADHLFFYIVNGDTADKTFTVKAGTGTAPSTRGGTGDLALTISHTAGGGIVGPIETNRFAQNDGSINLTFSDVTSVTISAYMYPTRW
jgi:hypothetical protein